MGERVRKPGFMGRAFAAWVLLNSVLLITAAMIVYVINPWMAEWYVMLPLVIAVIVSEWIIMANTIGPIIGDWIKQEEYVEKGEKPSWERGDGRIG